MGCERFQETEVTSEASERAALERPRPREEPAEWPARLLRESRVVVSVDKISVDGRDYPLTERTTIEAEQRGPKFVAALMCVAVGTIGIPATIVFNRVTPDDYSWLVGFPVAFVLGAIFRVLTAEATYAVVLVSPRKETPILKSPDHQLVISLVAALRDAKAALDATRRRVPAWGRP